MVSFINSFLSYVVQFLVICAAAAVAVTIGITLAKKKDAGKTSGAESASNTGKA